MPDGLIALWFLAGLWRMIRCARYFQIEEYMAGRYARWLRAHPEKWNWQRAGGAWVAATIGSFVTFGSSDLVPALLHGAAALIAFWQPPEREVKKKFVRTQRALRLLIAAFAVFGLVIVLGARLLAGIVPGEPRAPVYMAAGLLGLVLYLLSPLFLVLGNVAAIPVEAGLRRLYLFRAAQTLRRLQPAVIGITGSYGKTSTKHYLAHILNARYRAIATPKSYNTLMGVTLAINTLLRRERELDYFLVEMGAYVPGEIARICRLTRPQISIVTAVGPQHLERFGSLENTARAKFEIVAALPPDGAAILNGDDPNVRAMAERAAVETVILVSRNPASLPLPAGGEGTGVRFAAANVRESLAGLDFDVTDTTTGETRHFHAPLFGLHNVTNLLLATAAARQVGLSLAEIALRVASLEPFEHRLQRQVQPGGLIVLDDAYSANPVGAREALRVLGLHTQGRRILITPGMVELGPVQAEENRKLGQIAADYATDILLVGAAQTRPIAEGVQSTSFDPARLRVFETTSEATAWLRAEARAGDTVLFLNDLPDTYL